MRFFSYLIIIICLATCCSTPSSNSFQLEGFIEGTENPEDIILCYFIQKNSEWHEISDTAKIINGKFLFEGNIEELTVAELCFDNCNVSISVRLYLEPTTMKLRINKNQPYSYKLSGTKVEKENIELRKELESDEKLYYKELKRMDDLLKQINSNVKNDNNILVLDSLLNLFRYAKENTSVIIPKMNKIRLDFILRHNTYRIVPDLLYLLAKSELIPVDTVKYIYNNLPEHSKTGLMGKLASEQIEYLESEKNSSEDTLIGSPAPDFTRKDLSGKPIRLSDFKDKSFVLLDFWASWCAPCIKEIPKIKDLYRKYSKKGLTIISISIDTDNNRRINAIDKYQLDAWLQILAVEDKNNDKDISFMYDAQAIPHFTLIDKQGKIIVNGPGEEQLTKIDSFLTYSFGDTY